MSNASLVQQIKDRLDIVDYIGRQVPDLKKAGRYYKACCPFHAEKTPSFVVNPDTQSWRCFGGCADGGDIFAFAMKRNGWSFADALQELAHLAGVELKAQSAEDKAASAQAERLRGLLQTAASAFHNNLFSDYDAHTRAALDYARSQRGFSDETLRQFQMGYAPPEWDALLKELRTLGYQDAELVAAGIASQNDKGRIYDRFRHRLMIPIRDERGRVVGFGARALDPDDSPKYLNSPQSLVFDKSRLLFGLDRAKEAIRHSETAVIVEGYMDAIQAHQAGFKNVVAQMGTALTETQLRLLVPRYAKRILLALDADAAGQNAMRRSLEVARQALQDDYAGKLSVEIRILQMGDGAKDPDDILRETPHLWQKAVDEALPVADFVIQMETAHLSPSASLQERRALALRVLPILIATEDKLYRADNLQALARRLRIEERDMLAWAQELSQQAKQQAARAAQKPRLTDAPPELNAPPAPRSPRTTPASSEPPPLGDEFASSTSEEAPAFLGWDDHDDGQSSASASSALEAEFAPRVSLPRSARPSANPQESKFASRYASRAAEAYCLRLLLRQPKWFYEVNRKLSELAGEDAQLAQTTLSEFQPLDFSQTDYRALVALWRSALLQFDEEPLQYLNQQVSADLQAELDLLLQSEEALQSAHLPQLSADAAKVREDLNRRPRQSHDKQDLLRRALEVRLQRLRREQQELYFLLRDAQERGDAESTTLFAQQTTPILRAISKLDYALSQLRLLL